MGTIAIMVVLAFVSLAAGAMLRLRWTVLSIVPAMLVAIIVIIGVGLAKSFGFWSILAAIAASATCLQLGYLVGHSAHDVVMHHWKDPPGEP